MLGTLNRLFVKLIGGSRNDRIIRARMKLVREQVNSAAVLQYDSVAERQSGGLQILIHPFKSDRSLSGI